VDKGIALILRVALDTPLRRAFDYLPPAGDSAAEPTLAAPPLGVRVRVPFGRRQMIGVLIGIAGESEVPAAKLKAAHEILDAASVFDPVTFELLLWAADYYHHPVGEVIAAALPVALRMVRARAAANRVSAGQAAPTAAPIECRPSEVILTSEQAQVVEAIGASLGGYRAHLLHGVTGSGKTEVYLRAIAAAVARGDQALVLVPEIALTPQLVERFRRRFSGGIAVLHSALSGTERRDAWRAAQSGLAVIVIGTRSAVLCSLPRLGLIVVDEEHDASYKQQEGFRYSARDLAVLRAQRARVPIVLGSATPSLETLENAAQARYATLKLPQRPGTARAPRLHLVDLRKHASDQGLSQPAIQAIGRHLADGGQVIVFLNRRGYAPALFCNQCGWAASCAHCDARMTLHRRAGQLRCHHCGAAAPVPATCSNCRHDLNPLGQGTERVEETLARLFPSAPRARLDRDTAAGRGALEAVLQRVHRGEARILIGTQMLTKGHDFPDVSLVVILDADQGLFASDFRATERLAQTITQVAGRAGRASRPGEVLIQTEFPEHPLLVRLIRDGYEGFAASALAERRHAEWPPYSRLAMLRAEARDSLALDGFLAGAADRGRGVGESVKILGPATALMARRADHFRAHLLIEAASRAVLQRFLARWIPVVETLAGPPGLRWSIDVDPLEVD
jgi:primosomal protein N' (replication factor Y)